MKGTRSKGVYFNHFVDGFVIVCKPQCISEILAL